MQLSPKIVDGASRTAGRSFSVPGSKGGKKSGGHSKTSPKSATAAATLVLQSSVSGSPKAALRSTSASLRVAAPEPVAMKLTLTTAFDLQVKVTMQGARVHSEGSALPDMCKSGSTSTAMYTPTVPGPGHVVKGTIQIAGFEPIPLNLSHTRRSQPFVGFVGRWRYSALAAASWNWRENGKKPTEGMAADLELSNNLLRVDIRAATPVELKRCLQLQALREAEKGEDYDTLHAQLTKAKIAGVEIEHIEQAEERLKVLRKEGLHVHVGCDKDTLREAMQWERVTSKAVLSTNDRCPSKDCPCNVEENCGEVLEVLPKAVQDILGENSDKDLFSQLVDAALASQEGSVWKAGGKFIFSAFNRNQSVTALCRMLEGCGKAQCAKMMLALVKSSEQKYGGYVTAVQVNFHPSGETYHDQHRDIYSGKQRAGPNCTCSFRECVGTVCYSLGSTRACQLDTMTDSMSAIQACGECCKGRREMRWLNSGEAMYFNAPWNQNHMHGIPKTEETSGPRISVAFLLGSAASAAQNLLAIA